MKVTRSAITITHYAITKTLLMKKTSWLSTQRSGIAISFCHFYRLHAVTMILENFYVELVTEWNNHFVLPVLSILRNLTSQFMGIPVFTGIPVSLRKVQDFEFVARI